MESSALNPEIVISGDGSNTLRIEGLREHYHSHKGAITESRHVFIRHGLQAFPADQPIQLLEVGFGTGLNVLLTALEQRSALVHYTALEPMPLPMELVRQLNYAQNTGSELATPLFETIHSSPWETEVIVTDNMVLHKSAQRVQDISAALSFDLVYYDAFAPHAQPELWAPEIWKLLFSHMNPGGVLVTYCAKGQVRRDMQGVGFKVERLKGPPGKREMLRARKEE